MKSCNRPIGSLGDQDNTVIAIKPYLDDSPRTLSLRTLALITDGIAQHPIEADAAECARLRRDVGIVRENIRASSTDEQLLTAAHAIVQELAAHHKSLDAFIKSQAAEFLGIVSMLTATVKSIGEANEESGKSLDNIAHQLKNASTIDDMQVLRGHLEACLKDVGLEAERQKSKVRSAIGRLRNELGSTERRILSNGALTEVDRITGFGGRGAAVAAINESLTAVDNSYVTVLVLNKLQTVNMHYGYSVGDEVFCEFAARIASELPLGSSLYRWSGPTIIAILRGSRPAQEIRVQISRIAEKPFVKSLAQHGYHAYVMTSAVWSLMPLVPPSKDLVAQIDEFVSKQVPRTA
jgi:GGDEF domain-containing protein